MGTILSAKCKCGYTIESLKFGAGMTDFSTSCLIPAIDSKTMDVVVHDIKSNDDHSGFILYTDPPLHDQNCNCESHEYFDHQIRSERNYCPKCHQFNLDFMGGILFD